MTRELLNRVRDRYVSEMFMNTEDADILANAILIAMEEMLSDCESEQEFFLKSRKIGF